MEELVTSEEATSADVEKEIRQQAHAGQGRRPHRDHWNASRLRADMEREIQTVELEEKDAQEDC